MNNLIEKVINYYENGRIIKDQAITSYPNNQNLFDEASNYFEKAYKNLTKVKNKDKLTKSLVDYYRSEYHDCISAKHYMILKYSGDKIDLDKSIFHHNKRIEFLENAYKIIENENNLSNDHLEMKKGWKVTLELSPLMIHIYKARYYFLNLKFVEARDYFEEYLKKIDEKINLINKYDDLKRRRIYLGNIIGMKFNAVQMLAGVYLNLNEPEKMFNKFFECFLLAEKAFEANPEQGQYLQGFNVMEQNLKDYLITNKKKWTLILQEHDNSPKIKKIMFEIDPTIYLKTIKETKIFSRFIYPFLALLIPFGICISLFKSINSFLYSLISFILICLLCIFFNILLLRKDEQLSESSFFELTKLILKQFNLIEILKSLKKKNKDDN